MRWTVEVYCEISNGVRSRTVQDEALALQRDERCALDVAKLIGWLKAAERGAAAPLDEPRMRSSDQVEVSYRCLGEAVMLFWPLSGKGRLRVLRFGRAASGFPAVADVDEAARRLTAWRV